MKDRLYVRTPSENLVRKRLLHKACQISEERLHWGPLALEESGLFFCLLIFETGSCCVVHPGLKTTTLLLRHLSTGVIGLATLAAYGSYS